MSWRVIRDSWSTALKTDYERYGGWGYGHVLTHMVPLVVERGLDGAAIDAITTQTPARILTLTPA